MNIITITGAYNLNGGTTELSADTLLDFQGGYVTNGTLKGNYSMIKAAPYQIFDSTVTLTGTWKVDKVYPEYFGNIVSSSSFDSSTAINAALSFSNLTGCIVQLLPRDYYVSSTIQMRGGTTLEGTIAGSPNSANSASSLHGTNIFASLSTSDPVISILSEGNGSTSLIDCWRFCLNNLTIKNSGTSTAVEIKSSTSSASVPRTGIVSNLIISNSGGYAIDISGSSYIKIDRINISGGKGVRLTGTKLQEFIWMNQVYINAVLSDSPCIEINKGNNIYLSEIDTNDAAIGLLITNPLNEGVATEVYNLFIQRFNAARCLIGIKLYADSTWMTRIKISEVTISGNSSTTSAIYAGRSGSYGFTECTFDNINIDNMPSDAYAIKEENNSLSNCSFTNVRTSSNIQLRTYSKLTLSKVRDAGVYSASSGSTAYTITLSSNSIYNNTPIVVVNTNQKIPFSVSTSNTQGGTCKITVTFSSAPTSAVQIYYFITGYFM